MCASVRVCGCVCVQIISNSSGSLAADGIFALSATLSLGCGLGEVALRSGMEMPPL